MLPWFANRAESIWLIIGVSTPIRNSSAVS